MLCPGKIYISQRVSKWWNRSDVLVSLVTTCWLHVVQIMSSGRCLTFKPNDGIPVLPFQHGSSWVLLLSDVTLLVTLSSSSIALSSVSAMLLCLCSLLSDRRCKPVVAGDVTKLQLHPPSYNKLVLNSKSGYLTVILTRSCTLHAVLNHNRSVR